MLGIIVFQKIIFKLSDSSFVLGSIKPLWLFDPQKSHKSKKKFVNVVRCLLDRLILQCSVLLSIGDHLSWILSGILWLYVQWNPSIRTPTGLTECVLISGVSLTVDLCCCSFHDIIRSTSLVYCQVNRYTLHFCFKYTLTLFWLQ